MAGTGGSTPDLLREAPLSGGAAAHAAGDVAARLAQTRYEFFSALEREPWRFDVLALIRRIECLHTHLPRIGASSRTEEDPVRFGQEPTLAFPPCTVSSYRPPGDVRPPRLFVNFMGLTGVNGPMPLHITDFVRDREHNHKDPTLARFFDIFNNRMIALFYRAWASAQQTVSFDRAAHTGIGSPRSSTDRYAAYVGSLFGLGMESLRDRDSLPDVVKLHYCGRLIPHVKNAEGLRHTIEDYFKVPAEITEFDGMWLDLPDRYWCRLGSAREPAELGRTAVVGARVWNCQSKFSMRLGPMRFKDYQRLLPTGASESRLASWIRLYCGDEFTWEATLVLFESEVPPCRLGSGVRLGWTTWTATRPLGRNPSDLKLRSRPEKKS